VPDWNRPGVICPGCGAQERHRALALYLDARGLPAPGTSLLHFAPEYCLEQRLRRIPRLSVVTTDLDPAIAEVAADITALPFGDGSFDAVLCSHVLEHVEDDRAAMRELVRVLRLGGWAVVMVPLDVERESTLEDPGVTEPRERERLFWQHDHVRLYAPDLEDRLTQAGFDVTADRFVDELPRGDIERYGLARGEIIFRCDKPRVQATGPALAAPPDEGGGVAVSRGRGTT